tara:strand:- start:462 stop:635 length:174 start_codon:yes stop_codon:yes gene_type:complete
MKVYYGLAGLLQGKSLSHEFCKTNSKDGKDGKDGKDDNMMAMLKNSFFLAENQDQND